MKAYSVAELSNILKTCFENPAFSSIPVYGEVYSIKLGKFSYIELGDQGNKQTNSPLLRCAFSCFYGNDYHLEDIKVGDVITITGSLSYYPHGSSVTLWGKSVEILKNQEGKNLLAKKKTLEKLEKLGYLDERRKRKIPTLVKKVAILTAQNGAAYQDILKTLHDRFPVSTVLYPVTVQGDDAAKSIVSALKKAQNHDFDVILLGRGGGSSTDLSCFDDETLALTIAECKIPVITCIGHTIDTAIADRVSDKQAITPTEGASLINPSKEDIKEMIHDLKDQLNDYYLGQIKQHALNVESIKNALSAFSPLNRIRQSKEKIQQNKFQLSSLFYGKISHKRGVVNLLAQQIENCYRVQLKKAEIRKNDFIARMEVYNPSFVLSHGYANVYKNKGKIMTANELNVGDEIEIVFTDNRVKAVVKEKRLWEKKI